MPTSGGGHEVSPRVCRGHEVAIPVDATVQSLDAKEECLSTLLCYMELQGWLRVKNHTYDTCTLKCFGGKRQLQALARKVPAVAAAVARLGEKGERASLCQQPDLLSRCGELVCIIANYSGQPFCRGYIFLKP